MRKIYQFLPRYAQNDSVSQAVFRLGQELSSLNIPNRIFADQKEVHSPEGILLTDFADLDENSVSIFHSWGGDGIRPEFLQKLKGSKFLFRHFTPEPYFFAPYSDLFYRALLRKKRELTESVSLFDGAIADSSLAAEELKQCGFSQVSVLPVLPSPDEGEAGAADPTLKRALGERDRIFLVHAFLTPNQRIEDAIRLFAWYRKYINHHSKMIILGKLIPDDYLFALQDLIHSLGEQNYVLFLENPDASEIKACYELADLWLSAAEIDAPRYEAFYAAQLSVPSLVLSHPGTREVWGDVGFYVVKFDIPAVAELVELLFNDSGFRERVVLRQQERAKSVFKQAANVALGRAFLNKFSGF